MERKTSSKPSLCRGGCGFYGSAATEGLCSECYKKHVEHQQEAVAKSLKAKSQAAVAAAAAAAVAVAAKEPLLHKAADNSGSKLKINQKNDNNADNNGDNEEMPSSSQAASTPPPTPAQTDPNLDDGAAETAPKEKKNRCAECGKKVGLTGFTCRCGGLFCPIHRYSDKHNCTFNYREMGAEEIRRNNPTVTAEKIRKI